MTDTNQLPEPEPEGVIVVGTQALRGFTADQMRACALHASAILALRPEPTTLTGCKCRWDGDTQVEWCDLHLAHKEAIHEWAERAKEAEKQLALRPERAPMTGDQWTDVLGSAGPDMLDLAKQWADNKVHVYQVVNEAEKIVKAAVLRGITAQAKKETP